jgi:cadmium resistance protein CadD (predicted permease)
MIRSLWASVQGDPIFMKRVNGWLTIFWLVLIPIAWATSWVNSPAFISYLSMIALVLGSWSAWQAARVEVVQQQQERKNREAATAAARETAAEVAAEEKE